MTRRNSAGFVSRLALIVGSALLPATSTPAQSGNGAAEQARIQELARALDAGIRPPAAPWSPDSVQIHLLCTYAESGRENDPVRMNDPMPTWPEAQSVVAEMARKSGIRNVPKVLVGPVPNAAAAIVGNQRVIICNRDFIWELFNRTGGNKWALIAVLAHELGHHLNGDSIDQEGSTHPKERNADFASGFLMKRIGATVEDALIAIRTIAPLQATLTHPGQAERLHEIQKGYYEDGISDSGATPAPSSTQGPGSPAPAPGGIFTGGGSTPATPPSSEGKKPWIFDEYLPHSPIGAAPPSSSEGTAPVPSVPSTSPSGTFFGRAIVATPPSTPAPVLPPPCNSFGDSIFTVPPPAPPDRPVRLGVDLADRAGFVVIASVVDGTPASRIGMRAGDAILAVNGVPVRSVQEFLQQIDAVPRWGHVRLDGRTGLGWQIPVTYEANVDR